MKRDVVKRITDAVMDEIERANMVGGITRGGIELAVSGGYEQAHAIEVQHIGDDAVRDAGMKERQRAYMARLVHGGV